MITIAPKILPIETTASGTLPEGYNSVFVLNNGVADGEFAGARLPAGASINLPWVGRVYGEIDYDASGTSFIILAVS